ncbi:MAG: hypothetical protein NVSMB52_06840 [Chloroflexota bacterium]
MRNRLSRKVASFMQDESGQDMVEYALVVALIALGSVASMNSLANSISSAYNTIGSNVLTAL